MPEPDSSTLKDLGTFFGSDKARLLAAAAELAAPVGDGGFTPADQEVSADGVPLEVFGQATSLDASARAGLAIHPAAAFVPDLFQTGESYRAPQGTALASLDLGGKLSLGTRVPPLSLGALTLAVTGSATASFRYRHLLPVRQSQLRLAAFKDLAASARLPQTVRLERILPGEVHRLDALSTLSFGLEARWGKEFDLRKVLDLWDGLSAEIRAHVAATVQASLGWSLYEEMQLTVGSANLLNPGWVRIRLERTSERRFTLGAVVQVLAEYDASSVAMILQQTLDQSPLPRVVEALRPIAAGDWDGVKSALTDRAVATLDELLDGTGWKQLVAGSPEVERLVETANKIVDAYDGLGNRIASFWDRILGSVELEEGQPLRRALETVAGLQGKPVTALIENPEAKEVLALFELLTGKSLEDTLLGSGSQIQALVDQAAGLARRTLDFVTGLPAEAQGKLRAYADRLKITSTLDFLRANATSKEALITALDQASEKRIRQLVELLLGKAWERISDADLAKVQAWAARITAELDRLQGRLEEALKRFKGELGFSLAATLDRATTDEALIDLEVDPRDPHFATAVPKALLAGNVEELLKALPDLADREEEPESVPSFLLRESVLSHRRVRTNSLSTLFRFLGMKSFIKSQSQWAEEGRLTIRQQDSGFSRQGLYSGGLIRSASSRAAEMESSVWLEITAGDQGAGTPLAPFLDGSISTGASITFTYDDRETELVEQEALDELLAKLGFLNIPNSMDNIRRRLDGESVESRFALTLRLGPRGVADLLADLSRDEGWNESYLEAAAHWFRTTVPSSGEKGEVLAALSASDTFREAWLEGPRGLTETWAPGRKELSVGGQNRRVRLLRDPNNLNPLSRWDPRFSSLYWLANNRGRGLARFRTLVTAFGVAEGGGSQEALLAAAREAAIALKRAHPGDLLVSWTSPLFLPWLVLTRLSPAGRKEVRGVATFLHRPTGDEEGEWSDRAIWRIGSLPAI